MRVEIIDDATRLAAIEPDWWALWRQAPAATPFQSPAWLLPWWRAFLPGELRSVAVWDGTRLAALAPVYREDGAYGRRLLPLGIGIGDYLDVLIGSDPAAAIPLAEAAAEWSDWDSWELEELRPEAAAWALPAPPGSVVQDGAQSACPVLPLPADPEALAALLPKTKLRKWRMARNRLERRAEARLERVAGEDLAGFLDDLFALHGARWSERGESGVLADEAVRQFHRAAAPRLASAGLLRAYRLRVEGTVAGAYYGFADGRASYAYLGGFDPGFAFESPGTILVGHAIEEAVREGLAAFHFLRGQEPYKYEWGAADRWNRRRTFRALVHA